MEQLEALVLIVRSMTVLSTVSAIVLLSTFCFFREFRTLPSTLIFLASPTNLLANFGSFIGASNFKVPTRAACQMQGFMFEWFQQSDPYWSLAASITVALIFFRHYTADQIKNLYWLYCILCYGIPFVPAIVLLLYRKTGPIYGAAGGWCWIDNTGEHAWLRLWVMFLPVWISILTSMSVYLYIGVRVFKTRSQVRAIGYAPQASAEGSYIFHAESPNGLGQNSDIENKASWIRVPEPVYASSSAASPRFPHSAFVYKDHASRPQETISTLRRMAHRIRGCLPSFCLVQALKGWQVDEVKFRYTKSALLLITFILVTWVPPTVNRMYNIRNPKEMAPYSLGVVTSIVLPLQGFWNAVIFFSTSVPICRQVWKEIRARRRVK